MAVASLCGLALLLRLWGIGFGLPGLYHPDEPPYVRIALDMVRTGDPNPRFFNYPSLLFYVNALAYVPYYLWGLWRGAFASPTDMPVPEQLALGVARAGDPAQFLIGRGVTALFGALTVGVVCLLAARAYGRGAGALAGVFLAIAPTAVQHAHFITPDTYVTLFATFSAYFALRWWQDDRPRDRLLAAALAGFAVASKYNGFLAVAPLAVALLLRVGWQPLRPATYRRLLDRRIIASAAVAVACFFVATPYALITPRAFLRDVLFEARHYATGHPGMEGDAARWYIQYLWSWEGVVLLPALAMLVYTVLRRRKDDVILAAFPVAYFLMITTYTVRNERTALPLVPFLCLLAAGAWALAWRWLDGRGWGRVAQAAAAVALVACLAMFPARRVWAVNHEFTGPDARTLAQEWVDAHLPLGVKVAAESYAPFMPPDRYDVTYLSRLIDQLPEWYVANGYEYVIASQWMYGRFFAEPEKYPQEVAAYHALFDRFERVAYFEAIAIAVQVYKVRP